LSIPIFFEWNVESEAGATMSGFTHFLQLTESDEILMDLLNNYLQAAQQQFLSGNAREHSYRPALSELLVAIAPDDAIVTNEPARVKCGSPDFIIAKNTGNIPLGYVEAKDVGVSLDKTLQSEQLVRYLDGLGKLVLTDYLEFRFYVKGEFRNTYRIGEVRNGRIEPIPEQFDMFILYFQNFLAEKVPMIVSADTLAVQMAAKARLIRNTIEGALKTDLETEKRDNKYNSELLSQFHAFESNLIADLKPQQFADLYAQTIAYGMFAARLREPGANDFSRVEVARILPASNPFLRKLFQSIAAFDAEGGIDWVIDELIDIFLVTDVRAILAQLSRHQSGQEDPTIHFYEAFLAQYDPQIREMRGVYYTPQPVVEFMVRAVDELLKSEFGLKKGIADTAKTRPRNTKTNNDVEGQTNDDDSVHRVQILDPATGTGTFLNEIIRFLHQNYFAKMPGAWNSYVENDLLPRLNGFELLMAPYAMAHLKLDLLLAETGYQHEGKSRFRVFLTNTLSASKELSSNLFAAWLAQEAFEANRIKNELPVMVVIGNPPYSGESANQNDWIAHLMEAYKQEPDGTGKLKEKNPKWINDDYVKFIRYAEHLIESTGEGILAYITNHSYLDNPTFRGMRYRLMQSFDDLWIIDLHGNAKKKEKAPDGSTDNNIFEIQQGVAVLIAIRKKQVNSEQKQDLARVKHHDLWGSRNNKYAALQTAQPAFSLPFVELQPTAPHYFFIPRNTDFTEEYEAGIKINELFPVNSVGIVTARDAFTIHESKSKVWQVIQDFIKLDTETARHKYKLGADVRDWSVERAREDLLVSGMNQSKVIPIHYRPFDLRYTYYTGHSRGFLCMPRNEVMQNFIRGDKPIGIAFNRRIEEQREFSDVFVFDFIIQHHALSIKEANYIAPLYLYLDAPEKASSDSIPYEKKVNVSYANIRRLEQLTQRRYEGCPSIDEPQNGMNGHKYETDDTFSPEDILDYVYAVLHQPRYRERFAEFLKIDFPRIPWPEAETFADYVRLGSELRQWHIMAHPNIDAHAISYPIDGNNTVDKPKWKDHCVWINKDQYFAGIDEESWNFHIGGYQPLQKWLKDRKDRKGRALSFDELSHYMRIAAVLAATRELMAELDEL